MCCAHQSRATCQGTCSKEVKKVRKSQKKEAMPELGLLKAQQAQVKCDGLPKAAPEIQTAEVPQKCKEPKCISPLSDAPCYLFGEKRGAKVPSNKLLHPFIQKFKCLANCRGRNPGRVMENTNKTQIYIFTAFCWDAEKRKARVLGNMPLITAGCSDVTPLRGRVLDPPLWNLDPPLCNIP